MNLKNISILCNFMEGLNPSGFNMNRYTRDCNTPSCALGWACTLSELRAAGLSDVQGLHYAGLGTVISMTENVFGNVYDDLFSSKHQHIVKTPQQWADHCRAFLKSRGHDVLPPKAEFKRFMERVLKPVAVAA